MQKGTRIDKTWRSRRSFPSALWNVRTKDFAVFYIRQGMDFNFMFPLIGRLHHKRNLQTKCQVTGFWGDVTAAARRSAVLWNDKLDFGTYRFSYVNVRRFFFIFYSVVTRSWTRMRTVAVLCHCVISLWSEMVPCSSPFDNIRVQVRVQLPLCCLYNNNIWNNLSLLVNFPHSYTNTA